MRKRLAPADEPTRAELAAIEAEWPRIAAEMDLLDAEITMLYAADRGGPTPLDWRRLRRAEARVTRVAAELAAEPTSRKAPTKRLPRIDAVPAADFAVIEAEWPSIAAELDMRSTVRKGVA